jgi:LAO/AO transport system kinase
MELVEKLLAGDTQSLAKLITMMERGNPEIPQIMKEVQPHLRGAYVCGFTGPPGSGKSTLVDKLTTLMRKENLSVGIIAVDPSSPFTGGAVLGDRIRMQQHYLDEGVFIRSMALRESHGGLPRTVGGVIKLMDAFGKDFILVETVGVGQTELDIIKNSDTVTVLLTPEGGDPIQALKAGLLEIADILVVNKADRPGTEDMVVGLTSLLSYNPENSWWEPPVLTSQAVNNVGVEELYEAIRNHRRALEESGRLEERRREQRRGELLKMVTENVTSKINELMTKDADFLSCLTKVEKGDMDAYSAYAEIMDNKTLVKKWLS